MKPCIIAFINDNKDGVIPRFDGKPSPYGKSCIYLHLQ